MLRRSRYVYKLFLAFFITSVVPVVMLSLSFSLLSGGILKGSYKQQADIAIRSIQKDLNEQFEQFRHTVYSLSQDEAVITAIQNNAQLDRPERLKLYQKIYTALSGHIDHASIHIISLTEFPSLSSQQIPRSYLSLDDDASAGIFSLAQSRPQSSGAVFNSFVNERGNLVMMTLYKAIQNSVGEIIGYVILDLNKSHISSLCDERNQDVFSQILIVDSKNNLLSDMDSDTNDGNFSKMPFLSQINDDKEGHFTLDDKMVIYTPLVLSAFQVVGIVPLNVVFSNLDYLLRITLWFLLFCIILAILLAYLISRSISKPVHDLTLAMGQVEAGDLSVRIPSSRQDEIGLLFKRFNIMTGRIESLMIETKEEQEQLRVAERKALQAQINPHFLYNTLNTIKSIAKLEGINKITIIVTQLGKLLRNTIDNEQEIVSLSESFNLLEGYLAIQKIRFGDRLNYSLDLNPELQNVQVPKLILQPLVENAVIHGLEQKMESGTITVQARQCAEDACITISDDGLGMMKPWTPSRETEEHGVGMNNVHRRLKLLYGDSYGISVQSEPGKGTSIEVKIPFDGAVNQ